MLTLIAAVAGLWFLFIFPFLLMRSFLLGASIYQKGNQGQPIILNTPKFSLSRGGSTNGNDAGKQPVRVKLPDI